MSSAGLEISAPAQKCDDARCPFHGHVKVRGRLLTGRVVSTAGKSFVVIQMEYLHKVRKYGRSERGKSGLTAHLPGCIQAPGGGVATIDEGRPLAKLISF